MFERFTKAARHVVTGAVEVATDLGAPKVEPQHLLLSLAVTGDGVGAQVLTSYGVTATTLRRAAADATRRAGLTEDEIAALRSVGIDADEVFRRIEESFGPEALAEVARSKPRGWRGKLGSPFEARAKKVLELSLREAIALGHRHIGTEHIGVTYDDAKRRIVTALDEAA
jgi:ATP-dependent Clp protease ATP-binding subunit ClpA